MTHTSVLIPHQDEAVSDMYPELDSCCLLDAEQSLGFAMWLCRAPLLRENSDHRNTKILTWLKPHKHKSPQLPQVFSHS